MGQVRFEAWRWTASAMLALSALSGCAEDVARPGRDAGGSTPDAGATDAEVRVDAGPMRADAGSMDTDAGSADIDAGSMGTDAGRDAGGDRCSGVDCTSFDTQCTMGECVAATGRCRSVTRTDGTACARTMCTEGSVCMGGTCTGGTPRDCSAIGDQCNVGSCNPATGACGVSPRLDFTSCDDGDLCRILSYCTAGVCAGGAPVDCTSMDRTCVVGVCDPATGSCGTAPRADGLACDDGVACTAGTTCMTGVCRGGAIVPSDGDLCAAPVALLGTPGVQTVTGDSRCANNNLATTCGTGAAPDVFYTFTLTATREVTAETIAPTDYDTVLELRSATCGTGAVVQCDNDGGGALPSTGVRRLSRIHATLPAGTYFLAVDGVTTGAIGPYTLRVSIDTEDNCSMPPVIAAPAPGALVTRTGSTTFAVADYAGSCGMSGASNDHVYAFLVTSPGTYTFETRPTTTGDFDTVLYVRNSPCATGTQLACDDDGGTTGVGKSRLQLTLEPGTYYVFVDGHAGASGSYQLDITQRLQFRFSTCGATGRDGPSAAACTAAYAGGGPTVTVSAGIQNWTVPTTGSYRIDAYGSQGASATTSYVGGRGARMSGELALTAGQVLQIIVGQRGLGQGTTANGGGGGGSFVARGGAALIVAGGGGGTRTAATHDGFDAAVSESGVNGTDSGSGTGGSICAGGTGGGGGGVCASWGSGGGGFTGNGVDDGTWGTGGISFTGGGRGGGAGTAACAPGSDGGFGGGGAGDGCDGGGGGGGYSGGGGGFVAGGGGSFNAGTAPTSSAGVQINDGLVVITPL